MSETEIYPSTGDKAPDFSLPSVGAHDHVSSSKLNGTAFVLFFYPKDDTSGCTTEAKDFTSARSEFADLGVELIGISPDPVNKHVKFRDKHNLEVTLAADEENTALQAYGVWQEKSMYGKKYFGVVRSTFLIGKDGKVLAAWRKVKVGGHVDEVLETAKKLL